MPNDVSTDLMLRIKLTAAISIMLGLVGGAVGAVSGVYKMRDGMVAQEAQQRDQVLKNYPTRQELWQAVGRVSQRQDQHYTDLKDRMATMNDKVDGILVYLRKRL
jgi:hypothetical protein